MFHFQETIVRTFENGSVSRRRNLGANNNPLRKPERGKFFTYYSILHAKVFSRALMIRVFKHIGERFLLNERIVYQEDGLIFMTACYLCESYRRVNQIVYDYHVQPDSVYNSFSEKAVSDIIKVYLHFVKMGFVSKEIQKDYYQTAANHTLVFVEKYAQQVSNES